MLASAVSSTALGAMAAVEGFKYEQTLTGFKWLGNIAKARQAQGLKVLFAFEEAIGFMFPDVGMVSTDSACLWGNFGGGGAGGACKSALGYLPGKESLAAACHV